MQQRPYPFTPQIIGLKTDKDNFIVGRGLDYNHRFREQSDIRIMTPEALNKLNQLFKEEEAIATEIEKLQTQSAANNVSSHLAYGIMRHPQDILTSHTCDANSYDFENKNAAP